MAAFITWAAFLGANAAAAGRYASPAGQLKIACERAWLAFFLASLVGGGHWLALRVRWFADHPRRRAEEVAVVSVLGASFDALQQVGWCLAYGTAPGPVVWAMLVTQAAVGWAGGRLALQSVDPAGYPWWDRPAVRTAGTIAVAVALTGLAVGGCRNGEQRVRAEERLAQLAGRLGGAASTAGSARPTGRRGRSRCGRCRWRTPR